MASIIRKGMVFILFLVLAHYLTKADIGVFQEMNVLLRLITVMVPLGLDYLFLIEQKRERENFVGFGWMSVVIGGVAALLLMVFSGVIGTLYHSAVLTQALRWLGIMAWVYLLRKWLKFHYRKNLEFKELAFYETINVFIYTVGTLAFIGRWPFLWLLLGFYFLGDCTETCLLFYHKRHYFLKMGRFIFHRQAFQQTLQRFRQNQSFCWQTSASTIMNFYAGTPILLLGTMVEPLYMGVYYFADNIISTPFSLLMEALGNVLFPTFARFQPEEMASRIRRFVELAIRLVWPMIAMAAFLLQWFIPWFFKGKWDDALPLVLLLAVYVANRILFNPFGNLPVLFRKPKIELIWSISNVIAKTIVLVWMGPRHFVGAIFLFVLVDMIGRIGFELATLSLLGIPKRDFGKWICNAAVPVLLFAGYLWGLARWHSMISVFLGIVGMLLFFVEENYRLKGKIWQEISLFLKR